MVSKSVFCIANTESQAVEIIDRLKSAGFANDDIAALVPDRTGTRDFGYERWTKAPEWAVTGGLLGGAFGASFGWLMSIGVLTIPGIDSSLTTGPAAAAFCAAAPGLLAGGLLGALFGLGFPVYVTRRYDGKLGAGNILISVHCAERRAVRLAREIYARAGAGDIACGRESLVEELEAKALPAMAQAP